MLALQKVKQKDIQCIKIISSLSIEFDALVYLLFYTFLNHNFYHWINICKAKLSRVYIPVSQT